MKQIIVIMLVFMAAFVGGCSDADTSETEKFEPQPVPPVTYEIPSDTDELPAVPEEEPGEGACMVQGCHFLTYDPVCAFFSSAAICTLDIQPIDFCARFVSCDDSCNAVVDLQYKGCVDCFKDVDKLEGPSQECLERFPEYGGRIKAEKICPEEYEHLDFCKDPSDWICPEDNSHFVYCRSQSIPEEVCDAEGVYTGWLVDNCPGVDLLE
ncbi:hypothetical protein HQ545_05135 [Candidatus Woesearchaeota archaeon]|nr:hypothetical protein [Candidatus Woesearchaeota archaeon]